MTSPATAVLCQPWATWDDLTAKQQQLGDEDTWNRALAAASEILYALTQHRWSGSCPETTVVLRAARGTWPYEDSWGACSCWSGGQWVGLTYIPPPGAVLLNHPAPTAVRLPHRHVTVTAVTINGEPFTGWEVSAGGWLSRVDGQAWSLCAPTGQTRVSYTYGAPPPPVGIRSAIALGQELLRAELGQQCRLPASTVSVTRQGVTQQLQARAVSQLAGGVGLPDVDVWIRSVNPRGRAARGSVWSPDLPGSAPLPQSGTP